MRKCGCPSQPMWKATSRAAWEQIGTSYADARRTSEGADAVREPTDSARHGRRDRRRARERRCARRARDRDQGSRDRGSGARCQLSVQPTATFHGRIPDWINDVKPAQANGDHVVFVAGSHGRAERTVELLKDYDVRAVMASDSRRRDPRRRDRRRRVAVEGIPSRGQTQDLRPQAASASRFTPRPTSSTKSGARPAPARSDRRPPRSSPTCAISRSAI